MRPYKKGAVRKYLKRSRGLKAILKFFKYQKSDVNHVWRSELPFALVSKFFLTFVIGFVTIVPLLYLLVPPCFTYFTYSYFSASGKRYFHRQVDFWKTLRFFDSEHLVLDTNFSIFGELQEMNLVPLTMLQFGV